MSIYDYLDRDLATKKILRGWNDRLFAAEHNAEKIAVIRARLTKTTQSTGSAPVKGGGSSKEEQLVNGIFAIDSLEAEMNEADEVQKELEVCWNRLTEEERLCLREMFVDNEDRQGIQRIKDTLHIEKSEAYARVNNALKRLSTMLFW